MLLGEYLKTTQESTQKFANRALLCFWTVYRAIHGKGIQMSSAKKIVRATKKKVGFDDLVVRFHNDR